LNSRNDTFLNSRLNKSADYFFIHFLLEFDMKKNMGTLDRILRVIIALAIGVLYYMGMISGTVAIVLGALALVFLATSLVSTCPLYLPFNISTRPKG